MMTRSKYLLFRNRIDPILRACSADTYAQQSLLPQGDLMVYRGQTTFTQSETFYFSNSRAKAHQRQLLDICRDLPKLDAVLPGTACTITSLELTKGDHSLTALKPQVETAERLFIEKGYDRASLQDIIDATGLSKGAIYHHFTSKEDIFYSVCDRIGQRNAAILRKVRDDETLNGLEKLRRIFKVSLQPERQAKIFCMMPYLLDNAKFLATELRSIFSEVVPEFVEPIIRQGMADGSILTDQPRALAEAMILLSDVWINPIVQPTTPEEIRERCAVYNQLFRSFGIDGLINEEVVKTLENYGRLVHDPSPEGKNCI